MADENEETTLEEVKKATHELHTLVTKNSLSPEVKEKINVVLDGYEDQNQAFVQTKAKADANEAEVKELKEKLEAEGKSRVEVQERVETLESEMAHKAAKADADYHEAPEYKALHNWTATGEYTQDEKALLRTDSAVSGGFLVTTEMDSEITKKLVEIDGIRGVARVRSISGKAIEMAIRNTIPTAQFEGEAEQGTDSNSTYENVTVTPYRQTFTTPITQDMLQDAAFNMESEVIGDAQIAFAEGEAGSNGFVGGSGVKEPEGIIANATLTAAARETAASGVLDPEAMILLTGDLKTGYNPTYILNRRTLAFLRTLRDTVGQFLWQPGMNGPMANTLNGFNYVLANSMPDHDTAAAYAVAFGDFRQGYSIVDRAGMSIVRDEFAQKRKAIVEFTMNRWTTGKVVLPEAIKLLQIKA